ncbi:MAG: hypothetical protein PF447_07615 [Spirochaetaceae bacterium]|jgi:hypothetical protein|nr:hypothetical protein [Spirochaetaceae bacterium]
MDGQLSIEINSRPYRLPVGDTLKAEYGHYKMVVSLENQLDFVTSFTIDDSNPIELVDYSSPGEATLLEIKNIFSSSYFIVVSHQGEENIFYNKDQVNIPLGDCRVSINVGGFVITKDIHSIEPETLVIDYEEELKNL